MPNTRPSRPWRTLARTARFSLPLVVLALTATLGLGSAAAAGPGASAQRVCSAPAPGYMACFAMVRVNQATGQVQAFAAPSGYGPADIQGAYKLPATGAGRTVAIVDAYDLPTAEADLATYRSQFGLPPCTTANGCFRKINQSGGTTPPAANVGWGQEIALDLDMVSAACPQCKILLVEATSPTTANLGTAVNQAVAQGAVAVSNSYGGSESSSNASFDNLYYKHAGVAITASSGDSGFGTSYPASSPWVTSVGGTSLNHASNARGWSETVWSGAGSGCSINEAKPSFQHDTGCARRTMADVSAVADPATGVAVYDSYGSSGWMVFGGTSASSPIVASVFAMATPATAGTFPNSYPYANTSALFDVTSGSNGSCSPAYLCTGTTGYDGPTGLGTPNGVAAFGPGGPPPTNDFSISVSPAAGTVTAGSGTSATVSTATTSGSAQSVALSASGLPAGASASFSPASVTSGSSSTLTLSTSASTPAGSYPITITGTGASATHATTYTLTVNGVSGCASPGQKLANPGFESGAASWTATSGVIGQWGGSGQPTHGGTWDAWLDGYGRTHTDTVSQSVTIPSGCSSYTLSFWLHIDSAETTTSVQYDKLTVKLGSTTLATYSNLNKAAGYVQRSFNVAAFAGQTATLTFTGTEDSSLQTSFVLDDTALNVS